MVLDPISNTEVSSGDWLWEGIYRLHLHYSPEWLAPIYRLWHSVTTLHMEVLTNTCIFVTENSLHTCNVFGVFVFVRNVAGWVSFLTFFY